jgi:hypothetical protein
MRCVEVIVFLAPLALSSVISPPRASVSRLRASSSGAIPRRLIRHRRA